MQTRTLQTLFILTAVALTLIGCGGVKLPPGMPPPVPCEIVVTQEGQPLEGAVVRLQPVDNSDWSAVGRTDESGKLTIYTADKFKGAVPGKYKVIVSKIETEKGKGVSSADAEGRDTSSASYHLVDGQYRSASKTPLEIEVAKGTPTHTVDVGKAVRNKVEDSR